MSVRVRPYNRAIDYDQVGTLLVRTFGQAGQFTNWLQPTWEYMHFHSLLDIDNLHRFGIWEDDGKVVAVAHNEHLPGEVFLQIDKDYLHLKEEMISYSEDFLYREEENGKRTVSFYLDEVDEDMASILEDRGYRRSSRYRRDMTCFLFSKPSLKVQIPDGFQISDLEKDDDIERVHRVLHRGFNHPGEPPADEVWGSHLMQSAPNYRKDLNIVIKSADGNFVSYCGMWYEPVNKFAYIEPVATDPDFRLMGLGRAAVLEGIRRCGELGASIVYVGSDLEIYKSIGFEYCQKAVMWFKQWS